MDMGELHHLDVGCADASVIVTTATFLIDCHRIDEHAHLLRSNKQLRGVFITHQHRDHYSGLSYLRDEGYTIDHLVHSPYERRRGDASVTIEEWQEFTDLKTYFERQGTKCYAPYGQASWDTPFWDTNGVQFWVLGPASSTARSDTRELHDAGLVVKARLGGRKCLFTGDASDLNLSDVAGLNHICDGILHASHHGSLNGAELDFIKKANATYTVISTHEGEFENMPHPTALKRYAAHTSKKVYRTDQDGSLKWSF